MQRFAHFLDLIVDVLTLGQYGLERRDETKPVEEDIDWRNGVPWLKAK